MMNDELQREFCKLGFSTVNLFISHTQQVKREAYLSRRGSP